MIDKDLLKKMKDDPYSYEDLVVSPEGKIIVARYGHIYALEKVFGVPRNILYNMMDIRDTPIMWLTEKTKYMVVSWECTLGYRATEIQKSIFHELVQAGLIKNNYIDITEERKIAEDFYKQRPLN